MKYFTDFSLVALYGSIGFAAGILFCLYNLPQPTVVYRETSVMQLMRSCVADGHKDYECYSMLRGGK